jgi:nucleoid-associated protein YgaU
MITLVTSWRNIGIAHLTWRLLSGRRGDILQRPSSRGQASREVRVSHPGRKHVGRRILLKLLLMLAVGASAAIPLQRLAERRAARPAPAPVAAPETGRPESPAPAKAGAPAFVAAPVTPSAPASPPSAPARPADAASAAPMPPAASAGGRRTYVVKEGDSLWSIAEKELGNTRWINRLTEANRGQIDPNNLKVGQVIVIPDVDADAPKYR